MMAMQCHQERLTPTEPIEGHHVDEYSYQPHGFVYMTVCRTPGGIDGFMQKASTLFRAVHRNSAVFIINKSMPYNTEVQHMSNVKINPTIDFMCSALGIHMNDEQRAYIVREMGRRQIPRELWPQQHELVHNHHHEEDDTELQLALRLSLDDHSPPPPPPSSTFDYKTVLRPSEPAIPGQPLCQVCTVSRASICIVPCGHQVTCDDCIKIILEGNVMARTCIICRVEPTCLVRPIVAEVMEEVSAKNKKRIKGER